MDSSSQGNISNWSCSQGSHTKGDLLQIQDMKLQNEHLKQIISQLQGTVNAQNDQLNQALETAAAASALHDEITNLKLSLQDTKETANRTQRALKAQLAEAANKSEEDKNRFSQQIDSQSRELAQVKKSHHEAIKERDLLAEELDETKDQLRASLDKISKQAKVNTKNKDKNRRLIDQIGDISDRYVQLNNEQEQMSLENKKQSERIATLLEEIDALKETNNQINDDLKQKTDKCADYEKAFQCLQTEMKTTKDDFQHMSEDRERLLELVQKMQSTATQYEEDIDSLKAENTTLQTKAKRATTLTAQLFTDSFDFKSISFPFDEDLKARIMKVISFDHFQSPQKVQLIINECAKDLNKLHQENDKLNIEAKEKSKAFDGIRENYTKTQDMLCSVLREWKNLECNERKIDAVAFCNADEEFLSFLAEECMKLDNLPQAAEFLGPLFVACELFEDEAIERRKAIVDSVAKSNKDLSTLISAMFLINGRLKKEINSLAQASSEKHQIEEILHTLGVDEIASVPTIVESLQAKIKHLKDTRREVHLALVAARDAMAEKEKEETSLRRQVSNLQKKVEELQNENTALKSEIEDTKATFLNQQQHAQQQYEQEKQKQQQQKCNLRKTQTYDCSSANCSTISSASSSQLSTESELSNTIKAMQRSIQEKVLENESLKNQLELVKQQSEIVQKQQRKESTKVEQSLRAQIKELEDALNETTDKLSKTRRKAKKVVKDIKSQHEIEMNTVANNFESAKAEINECLTDTKDKAEKTKLLVKQLQDSLASSEGKNKSLIEENSKLHQSLDCLEQKIINLQEQFSRDQKSSQVASTVKLLNLETQRQKELKETKSRAEIEKQKAIDFFTQHLGALYGIVELDNDEAALTHLFSRIQADLGKLKFFQEQATKL